MMAHRYSRSDKEKWVTSSSRYTRRPPVKIPAVDNKALIEENKFTLIGRVTNPAIQKTRALVDFFLQHWKVEGSITGRDLGPHLFQFKFQSEKDLQSILKGAPYHFKRWMIILQRWEPIVSDFFHALIPFWISIHGIPLHYWTDIAIPYTLSQTTQRRNEPSNTKLSKIGQWKPPIPREKISSEQIVPT